VRAWLLLRFLAQPVEGDAEGEPGFGQVTDGALDPAKSGLEGAEEFGERERIEIGGKAVHGIVMHDLRAFLAEEADVMAAKLLVFEGDLTAEPAGG
jgi:hypothetical protein